MEKNALVHFIVYRGIFSDCGKKQPLDVIFTHAQIVER